MFLEKKFQVKVNHIQWFINLLKSREIPQQIQSIEFLLQNEIGRLSYECLVSLITFSEQEIVTKVMFESQWNLEYTIQSLDIQKTTFSYNSIFFEWNFVGFFLMIGIEC